MRGSFKAVVSVVAMFAMAPLAGAAEYYVDNGAGSDSNPGTEAEPWEHCPGMDDWSGGTALQPGDVVYFASDGVWELASGEAVLQPSGGVTYDGSSWGDGTRATLRAAGELDTAVVLFREDDPTEPTVVRGFEVDAGGTVTTGIGINWPRASGDLVGATKRIEDNVVHDVASDSGAGEYEYGIVVSSGYGGSMTVSHVEIIGNEVHDTSRGGINVYAANDDPGSIITDVLVRQNEVYRAGLDPNYGGSSLPMKNHVIDVVFEYNHVHDSVLGACIGISSHDDTFRGPEDAVIRHNIVHGCEQMGITINVKGSLSADIVGNIITGNTYQGIRFMDVADELAVRILNNTLVGNTEPSWSHEILVYTEGADVQTLEISNNIIAAVAETIPLYAYEDSITDHRGNLFVRDGGGDLVTVAGVTYSDADITTWEPDAVSGDPGFVDAASLPTGFVGTYGSSLRPDPDGLDLAAGSPALDAGVDLAASFATSINSVARPYDAGWDIGAYEWSPDTGDDDDDDDDDDTDLGDDDDSVADDNGAGGCDCDLADARSGPTGAVIAVVLMCCLIARRQEPTRPREGRRATCER